MKKIVAIGGGEIGKPGFPIETLKIDKETIELSGKKHPRLLFIPTASSDSDSYVEVVKKYFGKKLGCKIDVLYLLKNKPSKEAIRKKILGSDIVYVGGGNTLKMMSMWRKNGVDKILQEAYEKDIILSGVSAGAICWFRYGNSDSRRFSGAGKEEFSFIKIRGLNFVNALLCPHYDHEKRREQSLKDMTRKTPGVAIALDNCSALVISGDTYKMVTSKKTAGAYKVYWSKKKYFKEKIEASENYRPITQLFGKQ